MDRNREEGYTGLVVVDQVLPLKLPLLPLFSRPAFPEMLTPIMVNDEAMIRTVDFALEQANGYVGLVLARAEEPPFSFDNLFPIGTVAKILKRINLPDGSINVFVNTIKRFKIRKAIGTVPVPLAVVGYEAEDRLEDDEIKALTRAILSEVKEITENNPLFSEEVRLSLVNVKSPGRLADFIASILNIERGEQQAILEELDLKKRLTAVLKLLGKEKELLTLQRRIHEQLNEKLSKQQREFFLKEQLKAIRQELGMEVDEKTADVTRFRERLATLALAGEAEEKLAAELEKLSATDNHSPEYAVIRNYLETALALPWREADESRIDIARAAKILDADHFGLAEVKKRILEFLAVQSLKQDARGSILCLVGPPGVGKTSFGKSVARAMGRRFFRFSLGGMRDEAEIKGHRRTYIGAMPGKIIEALKITKTRNPVLMLDEIDKLGQSFHGDPSSALLEVLDPEQNASFRDHYLDIPFDLSGVFFITTANTLDTIPAPLLDRMEVIRLSGYIAEEKAEIAARYIVPRALAENGLPPKFVRLGKAALLAIADRYAREAGVRNLSKQVGKIMRRVAFEYAGDRSLAPRVIDEGDLVPYLGEPVFRGEQARKLDEPGLALGLAWTALGGEVLTIESLANPGKGGLKLTGKLGEVMSESATIAYSYAMRIALEEGVPQEYFETHQIHLHVPSGATPKDGPSAGITMASALLSLVFAKKIRRRLAMTGELSLSGDVLPIGGLKEKVIAAKRSGIREVILPLANQADLAEIPEHIRKGIEFHPVDRMEKVKELIFA